MKRLRALIIAASQRTKLPPESVVFFAGGLGMSLALAFNLALIFVLALVASSCLVLDVLASPRKYQAGNDE